MSSTLSGFVSTNKKDNSEDNISPSIAKNKKNAGGRFGNIDIQPGQKTKNKKKET